MKSAIFSKYVSGCFAVILSIVCVLSGCKSASFRPDSNPDVPNEILSGNNTPPDNTPNTEPPAPVFYDRLTGLPCEESIVSCRPLAVCVGNFNEKTTSGLSQADILIEAPYDATETRFWAIGTNWNAFSDISNISSVRSYMFPMINAFSAVCAFAGTDSSAIPPTVSAIDRNTGEFNDNFSTTAANDVFSSGALLMNAAIKKNYSLSYSGAPLPFRINNGDTLYAPSGNVISSLHFQFSSANQVDFIYDSASDLYLRSQNGKSHTDAATGEQLAFSNVILLFYNVSYYHTASGTTYTLDTAAGGNGFCYTGGRVTPINWNYDSTGNLAFTDSDGTLLTLNKGKTYIGMLKITDSSGVVAK